MIRGFLLLVALGSVLLSGGGAELSAAAAPSVATQAADDLRALPTFARTAAVSPAAWPTRPGPSPDRSGDGPSATPFARSAAIRVAVARAVRAAERGFSVPLALTRAGLLSSPSTGPPPLHSV